ncbi:MAG: hypothetical protein AAGD10_09005 [Myxococcota bacterium]
MIVAALTLTLMLIAVFAMSIGVMISGRRLRGSCGGLASGSCACKEQGIKEGCRKEKPASEVLHRIGELSPTKTSRDRA